MAAARRLPLIPPPTPPSTFGTATVARTTSSRTCGPSPSTSILCVPSTLGPRTQAMVRPRASRTSPLRRHLSCLSSSFRSFSTEADPSAQQPLPASPPYDILFCGTDSYALPIVQALHRRKDLCKSLAVITPPDSQNQWGKKKMNRSDVKTWAINNNIPHKDAQKGQPLLHGRKSLSGPENFSNPGPNSLLITASFGALIDNESLALFRRYSPSQAINLHPSLLPKLRGAAPIPWAIANRMEETGVTVQQLSVGKFDRGRILAQRKTSLPPEATYDVMLPIFAFLSSELLIDTLENLQERHRTSREQDEAEATYAPKIRDEDTLIDWLEHSTQDIEARWRAFIHLSPLHTYMWPPRIPPLGHSLLPVTRVVLDDIGFVPREVSHYKGVGSRLLESTAPRPGRAWFTHVKRDTHAISFDSLLDDERDRLRAVLAVFDKAQEGKEEWTEDDEQRRTNLVLETLKQMPRSRPSIIAPHRPFLPVIASSKVRLGSANWLPPATWWKNQTPRKDIRQFLRFGPPETAQRELRRDAWNKESTRVREAGNNLSRRRKEMGRQARKETMAADARLALRDLDTRGLFIGDWEKSRWEEDEEEPNNNGW